MVAFERESVPFSLDGCAGTRRFTVAEYRRMAELGILEWEEGVELLGGYIVRKGLHRSSPLRPVGRPQWASLRRFTVPEYHAMIAAGILADGEPVELLEGVVVAKMSRNPPHDSAMDLFRSVVTPYVPSDCLLRSQQAVTLLDNEPEPDFALVRGTPRTFTSSHPRPSDILLVVEVSDTSLELDREVKAPGYARNRLPVYWIVNVRDGWIEVYTNPDPAATPPAYCSRTDYLPGQSVPLVLDGVAVGAIPVSDLLP